MGCVRVCRYLFVQHLVESLIMVCVDVYVYAEVVTDMHLYIHRCNCNKPRKTRVLARLR